MSLVVLCFIMVVIAMVLEPQLLVIESTYFCGAKVFCRNPPLPPPRSLSSANFSAIDHMHITGFIPCEWISCATVTTAHGGVSPVHFGNLSVAVLFSSV
ncbi:hypothetical protein L195_g001046 [Trifolium pratense]|uniref:Uncharacterized protein n=1 Tax=Trifolium pratense TaxID=57577 RepID=A0A2K3NNL2_TRIPR|nr:hypothetical protein L195_g001046 [Trifolium pratense]